LYGITGYGTLAFGTTGSGGGTYRVSIDGGNPCKDTSKGQLLWPVDSRGLVLVDQGKQRLELILCEDHGVDSPGGWDTIDLDNETGDNSEVVASTSQCPEEVGILGGRCSHKSAVGEDNVGRDEVVKSITVLVLKERVSTAKERADSGHTLSESGD
jgi:hypothetical protein